MIKYRFKKLFISVKKLICKELTDSNLHHQLRICNEMLCSIYICDIDKSINICARKQGNFLSAKSFVFHVICYIKLVFSYLFFFFELNRSNMIFKFIIRLKTSHKDGSNKLKLKQHYWLGEKNVLHATTEYLRHQYTYVQVQHIKCWTYCIN